MFLKNAWYVAGWNSEIGASPVHRKIIGEPVALYRTESGALHAIHDSCPHRHLPLSMGCVVGETIRCGYHGMAFDGAGRCVDIPGQNKIPPTAHIRAYPVAERWNLVWIWMGDPGRADPDNIIDVPNFFDPDWAVNQGPAMKVDCHYQYMTDNLLDPSHVSFVHGSSLGNADTIGVPVETKVGEGRVIVRRWLLDNKLAPFFASRVKFEGKADRLQHYELRMPAHAIIKDVIAPAGTGAPEGRLHDQVWLVDSYNFVTPVDEDSCMYHWFQLRNYDVNDKCESAALTQDFIAAFEEDLVVLATVHRGMNAYERHIDLATDLGSNHARRMLKRMIAEEQEAESVG